MNNSNNSAKPKTRLQNLLAKIAGREDAKNVKPATKDEFYLKEIAENGGGGGGSSILYVDFSNENGAVSTTLSVEEIYSAYVSGTFIVARIPINDIIRHLYLNTCGERKGIAAVTFTNMVTDGNFFELCGIQGDGWELV